MNDKLLGMNIIERNLIRLIRKKLNYDILDEDKDSWDLESIVDWHEEERQEKLKYSRF